MKLILMALGFAAVLGVSSAHAVQPDEIMNDPVQLVAAWAFEIVDQFHADNPRKAHKDPTRPTAGDRIPLHSRSVRRSSYSRSSRLR